MKLVWASLLSTLACAPSGSDTRDSAGPTRDSASTARGQPNADRSREIHIDSVSSTNPITVFGRARTFENTVQLRVRDADGDVIAEEFTTSVGEMGHHNPYSAQLWIARDPGPRVTVEAFEYSANDGSERSLITRAAPYSVPRIPVTLMLPVGDSCTETRAFTRSAPRSTALARLLVEGLVAGPDRGEKAAGAVSPFPRGSDVKSVVLRDGTLTVDFNERLQNVGGSCAVTAIRQSVTRTLQALPTVKRVVITAAGSEKLALQP
jgi:hypothetical protein